MKYFPYKIGKIVFHVLQSRHLTDARRLNEKKKGKKNVTESSLARKRTKKYPVREVKKNDGSPTVYF